MKKYFLYFLLFIPTITHAQNKSIIDQIISPSIFNGETPFGVLLNQLFYIGLIAATILSVTMIVRGGLQYMSTDSITGKETGKNRIKAALGGLVLSFSAILILNTINPNLTRLDLVLEELNKINGINFSLPQSTLPKPLPQIPTQPGAIDQTSGLSEEDARKYFQSHGISINAAPGTTNVAGLGQNALMGIVYLKNASGAEITITGGTESGHKTHGVGKSIVDLRKNETLNSYIKSNATSNYQRGSWTEYKMSNGATYMDEGDHWHVEY